MNKTTYILAGGNDLGAADYGARLGNEVGKYIDTARCKVLSCFYSLPEEMWSAKATEREKWFKGIFELSIQYDVARRDGLEQQVAEADVVYFHGGSNKLLLGSSPEMEVLQKMFEGKVVIGSSAGANMLAQKYWGSTSGRMGNGRGLVDMNVMVHYGARETEGTLRSDVDWRHEESAFQKRIANETITKLSEGQFITVIKEQ